MDSSPITSGTREPGVPLTYRQSIEATAARRGWSCREDDGAMVVSDGRSECRDGVAGYGAAMYRERIERDDVHLAEARAYHEESRRRIERQASEEGFRVPEAVS